MTFMELRQLPPDKRVKIISLLVEGCSIRSIARIEDVSKTTILKLVADIGVACTQYHHKNVLDIRPKRIQADEIWSFVGCKAKNVTEDREAEGWGDAWVWVAIDPDTKLVFSYAVAKRDADSAKEFVADCADRVSDPKAVGLVQISTDGLKLYREAIEEAFGADVDYAMMQKTYGTRSGSEEAGTGRKYYTGSIKKVISGTPDLGQVTTSHVERQNLTMRMSMRRFTRKTNAFSKKLEYHEHAVALHFMHYNFCRVHETLRVTPAMEAGLTQSIWTIRDLVNLIPKPVVGPSIKDRALLATFFANVESCEKLRSE